ncbi:MAG: hypothetical protein WBO82_06870 [Neisseria sp.]
MNNGYYSGFVSYVPFAQLSFSGSPYYGFERLFFLVVVAAHGIPAIIDGIVKR